MTDETYIRVRVDMGNLDARLDDLAERISNRRAVMEQVAVLLEFYVMENFENAAQKFAPLSDTTIDLRRASESPQILRDTGTLANSIFTSHGEGDGGFGGGGDAFAAAITLDPIAKFHIYGTRRMPQRNFFDVPIDTILRQGADSALDVFCQE